MLWFQGHLIWVGDFNRFLQKFSNNNKWPKSIVSAMQLTVNDAQNQQVICWPFSCVLITLLCHLISSVQEKNENGELSEDCIILD